MPNEKQWVESIVPEIQRDVESELPSKYMINVCNGYRLPYAYEVLGYEGDEPILSKTTRYETDILISEQTSENEWLPRIIIECKIRYINTHDAITYSNKASTHKNVHPYLRYGILLGNRKTYPLPGRLIRHGAHFDFMASWKGIKAEPYEWNGLIKVLSREFRASQQLQEIIESSRSKNRKHYFILHRRLDLK
jgi:hypothetical protein